MEHVEPFRPLLGLVDHAGDTSKLTRQADIEPEAGSPQSRSQPRARARRPAGEQITVCLGPLKKLIPESSVEGLPVAIGIVIVFQLACRNALLQFGQALPRLLDHPACPPVGRAPPDHGGCSPGTADHATALALPPFVRKSDE